jgi:23S rRNA (cytidine1920-2'-O)/16S rRNA (cytidine1409-2'-O)-methyltransferase
VVAVDVGHGQLHERLRADPRVTNVERTNLRTLDPDVVGAPVDVVVADLSFISLRLVLPPVLAVARPGALLALLVKPQFEAGRSEVAKGRGVVTDPAVWRRVLVDVSAALGEQGASIMGAMVSPITGSDGNVEFVLVGRAPGLTSSPDEVRGRSALVGENLERELDRAVAEAAVLVGGDAPAVPGDPEDPHDAAEQPR